jgi:rod shape-determining protein MreB
MDMTVTPDNDTLRVGIDLGTSRSAVAASNGHRAWVESYVGWPRDFVARKVLGAPVVFGEQALKHRNSVDLCRPMEYGVIKEGTAREQDAIVELVRHLISKLERAEGQRVHAVVGVPAECLRSNKDAVRRSLAESAQAVMLVSEPFAVAYGRDLLSDALIVDIGAGTVDFCVMHGTLPGDGDQRSLITAGDHIDRQLLDMLSERHPKARLDRRTVRQIKERLSFVGEPAGALTVDLPVDGAPTPVDVAKEMRQACESIVQPIVETALELISRLDAEQQAAVRGNILLAGGGSQIRGLAAHVEHALSEYGACKVTCVEDPLFAGAEGCLALANDMPPEYWTSPAEAVPASA